MHAIQTFLEKPWVYWTLFAAYTGTIISIIGIILSENRNPLKSLAWITVLMLFPVGGIVLYVFFGRSIKNTRMISRRNRRRLRELAAQPSDNADLSKLSPEARQQIQLSKALTGATFYPGNSVEIFTSGKEKFESLLHDISNARHYINLQYYIFSDDSIGRTLADALIERAKHGVKVRVIYDHIGCLHVSKKFFKRMTEAGIEAYPFFKVVFPLFATRINWRNHRKLVVIDGEIGYIGGMNVADRYVDGGSFGHWRDAHIRVTGPAVAALQYSFAVDWRFMGNELIEDHIPTANENGTAAMHLLTCGPTSEWSNIAYMLLKSISNAKKHVYIMTPYFLPTESLLKAIQAAALSRVDVRIMIPRRSDSLILTYASRSYVNECLRAGVKIYLYDRGMLHSKAVMIDDDLTSIGSANIDFRSFEHNFEANMFIYSTEVNSEMRRRFTDDQAHCSRVKAPEWRKRPLIHKIFESILRLLSPVL